MDLNLNVPGIKITSSSIDKDGKLMTECAADQSPNQPLGKNKSPQLSWNEVEGASLYAVCMFDEDANWLHWMVSDVAAASLKAGKYTAKDQYIGPYPPKFAGRHRYRIDVFALRKEPDKIAGKMDTINRYQTIVSGLNTENKKPDNILAMGTIVGTYANGDNTK